MTTLIITVLGDDRTGLVEAVSGAVADRDGNWVRSHLAELAGKFAGIIEVRVPEGNVDAVIGALEHIEAQGLLHITAERANDTGEDATVHATLELMGQDHPGIIHEVSNALAEQGVTIDELATETVPAPQGGHLFRATATVGLPAGLGIDELETALESIAHDLMVDLQVTPTT